MNKQLSRPGIWIGAGAVVVLATACGIGATALNDDQPGTSSAAPSSSETSTAPEGGSPQTPGAAPDSQAQGSQSPDGSNGGSPGGSGSTPNGPNGSTGSSPSGAGKTPLYDASGNPIPQPAASQSPAGRVIAFSSDGRTVSGLSGKSAQAGERIIFSFASNSDDELGLEILRPDGSTAALTGISPRQGTEAHLRMDQTGTWTITVQNSSSDIPVAFTVR